MTATRWEFRFRGYTVNIYIKRERIPKKGFWGSSKIADGYGWTVAMEPIDEHGYRTRQRESDYSGWCRSFDDAAREARDYCRTPKEVIAAFFENDDNEGEEDE